MSAEDGRRARRYFIQFVNEDGAEPPKTVNDMPIMNDFMPNVDRWSVLIECSLYDFYGANDARAKAARVSEQDRKLTKVAIAPTLQHAVTSSELGRSYRIVRRTVTQKH